MTLKQKLLKKLYPLFSTVTRLMGKNIRNIKSNIMAPSSFYDLQATLNNGAQFSFSELRGKKVLLVNTASECGYTRQYDDLQKLHEKYKDTMVVIGFPANDFGEQEKGSDQDIESFCRINYGVNFRLAKKSTVIKIPGQNPVYNWLTDESKNGWNDMAPTWNFCKYLVDESGNLIHFFEASIEPLGKEITAAVEQ